MYVQYYNNMTLAHFMTNRTDYVYWDVVIAADDQHDPLLLLLLLVNRGIYTHVLDKGKTVALEYK